MQRAAETHLIDINDAGAMDVLRSPVNGGIFELARRRRGGMSLAQLAQVSGLALPQVTAAVDALVEIGLLRFVGAKRGKVARYAATCARIGIVCDPSLPAHSLAIREHFEAATADVVEALRASESFDGRVPPGQFRTDIRVKLDLRKEEWPEFLKRLRNLYDYLDEVAGSRCASGRVGKELCNHALLIKLAPVSTPLLPNPRIGPTNPQAAESRRADECYRPAGLSERERTAAMLAARGQSRREVASVMGVSPTTVATLLRRAYLKLGVHHHRDLRRRLDRADRHERFGERE